MQAHTYTHNINKCKNVKSTLGFSYVVHTSIASNIDRNIIFPLIKNISFTAQEVKSIETRSHYIAVAGLELVMKNRLALKCLCLPGD